MKRLYLIIYVCVTVFSLSARVITPLPNRGGGGGEASLATILDSLATSQTEYAIHFIHNDLEHLRVSARLSKNLRADKAVERLCKGQPVKVKRRGKQIFVQYKPENDLTDKTIHLFGDVKDGFLEMPLIHAKVSILRTDSSVVVDSAQIVVFYRSNMQIVKAQFGAEVNAAEREYLVRASLEGYDDVWQRVQIPRPLPERGVEVPTLKMRKSSAKTMREVTITATKIKMYYRGDTIVYDATAFKMPEGSMLDDLIRQLPGVTMNADGEIFVNGRKVDELLLGSRSFFGGNKKVLLENLPYYTVKNLKVYEKQTDKSVALGYDVEPRRYVMDVNLKDEYSQGYIGNVEAAGGWPASNPSPREGNSKQLESNGKELPSYGEGAGVGLARGFLLGFTDRLRFTLLANANNVNESRHIGQSDQWSPARQPRSLLTTRSVAGELNYHSPGDKLKETFRAEYTSSTDEQTMHQRNERFIEGCSPTSVTASFNRAGNRNLHLHNSLTLTKPFYLYAEADFNHARRDGSFNSAFDEWSDSLTVSQRTFGMSEGKAWNIKAAVQGAIKVGRSNQTIDYFFDVQHSDDESEKATKFETRTIGVVSPSGDERGASVNSSSLFNRSTWGAGHIGFGREIAKNFFINLTDFIYIREQHNRDNLYHPSLVLGGFPTEDTTPRSLLPSQLDALTAITDPANSYDSRDRDWSNNLIFMVMKNAYYMHSIAHVSVDYARWQLYIRTPIQHERLHYQRGALDTLASQTVFLPNFTFSYRNVRKDGRRDFHFNINFDMQRTLLLDRINFRDDSQPLIVKLGNPDLEPSAVTKLSAEYYDRTGHNNGMYYLSASFNYHHRDVAQSLSYNPATGVYTYKPMNISGACGAFVMFSTDQNIGEKRYWSWHINAGPLWDHAKDHAMLEGQTQSTVNTVNTFGLNGGANVRYNRKTLNIRAVGSINWRYSLSPNLSPVREGSASGQTANSNLSPLPNRGGVGGGSFSALDFQYGLEASYTTPALCGTKLGGLTLAADGTMFSRRGYGTAALNSNDLVLNASLSQPIAKGRFILRLQAFDLLHQLSPIDYTVNAQGRTVTWYRSLPHYVMFHAVWHFNNNPKKK